MRPRSPRRSASSWFLRGLLSGPVGRHTPDAPISPRKGRSETLVHCGRLVLVSGELLGNSQADHHQDEEQ